jgi:hypothetical protein
LDRRQKAREVHRSLFRTIGRGTATLTRTVLPQANAYAMIRRRAAAAGIETKMLIVGAVEVQDGGAGPGRIRLNKVSDYSADSLHPFIAGNLAPGATATPALKSFPAPRIRFLMAVSAISRFFRYLFTHLCHRLMSDHPETRSRNAALARISRL